jgi:hypothetical protein
VAIKLHRASGFEYICTRLLEVSMQELRPWVGKPPLSEPLELPGFRLIRIEFLNILMVSLLGLALAPFWFILFAVILTGPGGQDGVGGTISTANIVIGLPALVALIVLHEALHGLAVAACGNKPSFGAGPGFFYTTCHEPLSWKAYALVLIAPFAVINGGAIFAALLWPETAGWALFLSLINAMGAGGDLWMLFRLTKAPRDGRILDLASGFAVYGSGADQATTASSMES